MKWHKEQNATGSLEELKVTIMRKVVCTSAKSATGIGNFVEYLNDLVQNRSLFPSVAVFVGEVRGQPTLCGQKILSSHLSTHCCSRRDHTLWSPKRQRSRLSIVSPHHWFRLSLQQLFEPKTECFSLSTISD